ncbi:uncharacterized protein M6B38_347145 [Iris pallida]|uniref:Uncharacterized protein n=1 Tax=Iris pallida TaxID=29817 RepID=A0AAX6GU39_IRIPA|nr:uncharacterized protein M6B38_347145 [Iris pallida]
MMASDSYFLGSHQPSSLDWDPHSFVFGDLHDHTLTLACRFSHVDDVRGVVDWVPAGCGGRLGRPAQAAEGGGCDRRFRRNSPGFWDSSSVDGSMGNLNCLFQDTSTTMADEFIMDFSMPMKETLVEAPNPKRIYSLPLLLPLRTP